MAELPRPEQTQCSGRREGDNVSCPYLECLQIHGSQTAQRGLWKRGSRVLEGAAVPRPQTPRAAGSRGEWPMHRALYSQGFVPTLAVTLCCQCPETPNHFEQGACLFLLHWTWNSVAGPASTCPPTSAPCWLHLMCPPPHPLLPLASWPPPAIPGSLCSLVTGRARCPGPLSALSSG